MDMRKLLIGFLSFLTIIVVSCEQKQEKIVVDKIYFNAKVYTVDSLFSIQEAFAIKDSKFLAVGNSKDILEKFISDSIIDVKGKPIYPGVLRRTLSFRWLC